MMRTLILTLMAASIAAPCHAVAGTIDVVPGPGTPIQDAIDAALPGDTVKIAEGLYNEPIVVNKAIRVLGKSLGVHIDAGCATANALEVTSDDAEIIQMRVDGGTTNGVVVEGRSGVQLKNMGIFNTCDASGAAVRLVGVTDLRLRNVRGEIWPTGTYVANLASGARVKLKYCGGDGSPFGGENIAILVENVQPGALEMTKCQAVYAVDAGIELRNADGVKIGRSVLIGRGTASTSRGIVADADSSDNSITRNFFRNNQTDVVDSGISNCWRRNVNPDGPPVTGNPTTTGCP